MFPYKWFLKDGYPTKGIEKHGCKVFSTFACGGGSTMGYKLAGYDVIGCNELDQKMMEIYQKNHHPKYAFREDIRAFKKRDDLPEELFNLDILDGSPPCSTFSTTGQRDKAWGKEKVFREGQAKQRLDDLFFHFIDVAMKLQPKIVIAENVKGMMIGNAKGFLVEIRNAFNAAGYDVQLFLLNAASMGIPQIRERVFFLCRRKDLGLPKIELHFDERPISLCEVEKMNDWPDETTELSPLYQEYWKRSSPGQPVGKFLTIRKEQPNRPVRTIIASNANMHYSKMRTLSKNELLMCSSFPLDYQLDNLKANYLCGMSVPPVMIAQIARQVYTQWLSQLQSMSTAFA